MSKEKNFSILWPTRRDGAIEERYATAYSRMRIAGTTGAPVIPFESEQPASEIAARLTTDCAVVVTDNTMLPPSGLTEKLVSLLGRSTADAVVPTTAESAEPAQRAQPFEPYLALGQFEEQAALIERSDRPELERFTWGTADPGICVTRTEVLRGSGRPLARLLEGRSVDVARRLFAHRFVAMRGQARQDLLERIPPQASSVLEFGCGEGALAAALKARQACRVVGVELDAEAGRVAAGRVDRLVSGDVRELLASLDETFDFAIGGDIVEHLDDPWTFLIRLRRIMRPGGRLLLSLPNVACWAIAGEALKGRFDYVYIGITCVGHLRFFTRRSIEEMLRISGWKVVSIESQPEFRTAGYQAFVDGLRRGGVDFSEPDLLAPGYYVLAEA